LSRPGRRQFSYPIKSAIPAGFFISGKQQAEKAAGKSRLERASRLISCT
jgi:uncharacterized protein YbdZ (MbtH family)